MIRLHSLLEENTFGRKTIERRKTFEQVCRLLGDVTIGRKTIVERRIGGRPLGDKRDSQHCTIYDLSVRVRTWVRGYD